MKWCSILTIIFLIRAKIYASGSCIVKCIRNRYTMRRTARQKLPIITQSNNQNIIWSANSIAQLHYSQMQTKNAWWRHQMETSSALLAFVRGIHRWPVKTPHKAQWQGALIFSLICAWTNGWVNNQSAGDLRRHLIHYDVTVMVIAGLCAILYHTGLRHIESLHNIPVNILFISAFVFEYECPHRTTLFSIKRLIPQILFSLDNHFGGNFISRYGNAGATISWLRHRTLSDQLTYSDNHLLD